MNAVEIEEEVSKLAALPFDRAEFACLFLATFGNKDVTLERLRVGPSNVSDVRGVILRRNNLHIGTYDISKVDDTLIVLRESAKASAINAKCLFPVRMPTKELNS